MGPDIVGPEPRRPPVTAPDPTPRPHLVGEPSGASRDTPYYPAPGYPHHDGSPLALWQQRASDHQAAQQLTTLTEQAEAWKAAQHRAFLADAERALQRARAEADLSSLRVPQLRDPGQLPDRPRTPVPDVVEPPYPEESEDDDRPRSTLDEAAAVLFKVAPKVSRDDLQMILQTNTYWARKYHGNRPGAAQ
jgi:hypothetical protein